VTRTFADPVAVSVWMAVTLAGIATALVASQAVWAVVAWSAGGVAAAGVVAIKSRRGR